MININTDLSSLQNIALSKKNNEVNRILEERNLLKNSLTEESSQATELELSEDSKSPIVDENSTEDVLDKNLGIATNICASLETIRKDLSALQENLRNPNLDFSLEELEEMDKISNELINKVSSVLNNNNAFSLVGDSYINIYLKGLNLLKELKISDEDYLSKLDSLKLNLDNEVAAYYNLRSQIYDSLENISKTQDAKVDVSQKDFNSSKISKDIILFSKETLESVSSRLNPETVMRLLQG